MSVDIYIYSAGAKPSWRATPSPSVNLSISLVSFQVRKHLFSLLSGSEASDDSD